MDGLDCCLGIGLAFGQWSDSFKDHALANFVCIIVGAVFPLEQIINICFPQVEATVHLARSFSSYSFWPLVDDMLYLAIESLMFASLLWGHSGASGVKFVKRQDQSAGREPRQWRLVLQCGWIQGPKELIREQVILDLLEHGSNELEVELGCMHSFTGQFY